MSITLDEIAKRLGVSRSTVSRALRDHPRISEATRRRIKEAAREFGYIPNQVAQSLNANRTWSLGTVITHISDPFIWRVMDGVEQVAAEYGYSVFQSMARNDTLREVSIIEEFQRRRVDGIIVASSHLVDAYSERLQHIQTPLMIINNQSAAEHFLSVSIDDFTAAHIAVQHLVELGHRRIGYISAPDRPKSNEVRYQGYCTALRQQGLTPTLIQPRSTAYALETKDFEFGKQAGLLLAEQVTRHVLTAVFCYNDMVAIGVIAALKERHLSVPGDVSLIGFDDVDIAQISQPALTTVRQPMVELGRIAAQRLMLKIEGQPANSEILPCELVVRHTTAANRFG